MPVNARPAAEPSPQGGRLAGRHDPRDPRNARYTDLRVWGRFRRVDRLVDQPTPARHARALRGQHPGHVSVALGGPVTAAWPPRAARDTDDADDLDGSSRPERSDSPAVTDCGAVRWRRPAGSGLG